MNFREIHGYLDMEYGTTVTKDEFVTAYHESSGSIYDEHVVLMDDTGELSSDLRAVGKKLTTISSAPRDWTSIVHGRSGLDPLDLVLPIGDIDKPGKPEPHTYEHIAIEFSVAPKGCVIIEGSINGIETVMQSGAYTIVCHGRQNADLDLSWADRIIDGVAELRVVLLGEEQTRGS